MSCTYSCFEILFYFWWQRKLDENIRVPELRVTLADAIDSQEKYGFSEVKSCYGELFFADVYQNKRYRLQCKVYDINERED